MISPIRTRSKTTAGGMMMKKRKYFMILVGLILAMAVYGCSPRSPEPEVTPEETTGAESVESSIEPKASEEPVEEPSEQEELAETIETTFLIEGMEEQITLRLFQDHEMPFYTYYPEDMTAETISGQESKSVRFVTNYGGIQNPEAFVSFTFYHRELIESEEAFADLITGESGHLSHRGYEWVEKADPVELMHDWTFREYFFMSDEYSGALYAGMHEDHYFFVDIHYPWEYGDGLEARANILLKEFRWMDGRVPLIP